MGRDVAKKREYDRLYREANKARLAAAKREYHVANRERLVAKTAAWQKANPEKDRANRKNYRERHKEEYNRRRREMYAADRERLSAYKREAAHKYRRTAKGALVSALSAAKDRAKKFDREYDLDPHWLKGLYDAQEGRCALTGIAFEYKDANGRQRPFSPSIDRVDNSRGYTKDNCRLICTALNVAFSDWGEDVFLRLASGYMETQFP